MLVVTFFRKLYMLDVIIVIFLKDYGTIHNDMNVSRVCYSVQIN